MPRFDQQLALSEVSQILQPDLEDGPQVRA
jgi:hypothetical protein